MKDSAISWTHHTKSVWRGCSKVHTGCLNCFAEYNIGVKYAGIEWGKGKPRIKAASLDDLLTWNRAAGKAGERHRVFINQLADFFEPDGSPVHDHHGNPLFGNSLNGIGTPSPCRYDLEPTELSDLRREAFDVFRKCDNLDLLLLTKHGLMDGVENVYRDWPASEQFDVEHFPGVWLGCSVSDHKTAHRMIENLLKCKPLCKYLWVSHSPATGPVNWDQIPGIEQIDWLVIEGESDQPGCTTRRFEIDWARQAIAAGDRYGFPVHVKQIGSFAVDRSLGTVPLLVRLTLTDEKKKGGKMDDWPEESRRRDYPGIAV